MPHLVQPQPDRARQGGREECDLDDELVVGYRGTVCQSQQGREYYEDPAHEFECWGHVGKSHIIRRFAVTAHCHHCTSACNCMKSPGDDHRRVPTEPKPASRFGWLEAALVLSLLTLVGQLCWPSVVDWWRRPVPGAFGVVTIGCDAAPAPSLTTLNNRCVVWLPPQFRTSNGPWPLVVFLHGSGERGNDVDNFRQHVSSGPFRAITDGRSFAAILAAPQCRERASWQPAAVAAYVRKVALQYDVDLNRVYLVGYSMGGYGTWQTVAQFPELFAAAVPISGGGDVNNAAALANVPIWAFHGDGDKVVPIDQSRQMIEAVHAAGGHPRLTVLEGAGHGICSTVLSRPSLWDWLLRQRRGPSAEADTVGKGTAQDLISNGP